MRAQFFLMIQPFSKAMITALQSENAKMSAALKAHDHLIQGGKLRNWNCRLKIC